jgi:hypothetical protein
MNNVFDENSMSSVDFTTIIYEFSEDEREAVAVADLFSRYL